MAKKELGATKKLAVKARAEKELKTSKELKMEIMNDDEELALIIIFSEV